MLKLILTSFLLLLSLNSVSAQAIEEVSIEESSEIATDNTHQDIISRNLFVQFFGSSLGIGIGYDQRFRPNSVFGFSAGLAFTNLSWDNGGWWGAYDGGPYTQVDSKGLTIPLEINAIMGKRASKFELGVSAVPCILHRYEKNYPGWNSGLETKYKDGIRLNIYGSLDIGYRLQRKNGFFLRAGVSYLIGDLKCSPIDALICLPSISLGYTIRE